MKLQSIVSVWQEDIVNQNFGATYGLDRVLEWHQLSQKVVGGLVKLLDQHKLALEATGGLDRMLEQHKLAFEATGGLDRMLEQHKLAFEAAGGLGRMLEQHKSALEATGGLGRMLEQHKLTLEAAGGLGRMLEQHKLALEAAGELSQTITVEAGKRGGQPCIRGLRITVYDILECLASGMTEDEMLSDFPDLTPEDIRACLAFAADLDGRLMSLPTQ